MNSFVESEQINAHSLDTCLLVSGLRINQLARVMRWWERVAPGRCETLDYCQQSRSWGVVLCRADMLLLSRRLSRRPSMFYCDPRWATPKFDNRKKSIFFKTIIDFWKKPKLTSLLLSVALSYRIVYSFKIRLSYRNPNTVIVSTWWLGLFVWLF